ncbi:MAG TPA: type II CRISPR-associated endonuclease Cas1 [Bacteroidetes bacterium]|nr:type II CRISPR-associated endonuclease Cas1 [Candidatus Limimorpha avicola]
MIKRTLYFGNPSYLSLNSEQLVIRLPDIEKNDMLGQCLVQTIPIEDIGVMVLDNKQITLTQGLLEKLLENNCSVITCDSSHLPVGLLLPIDGNTVQSERFRKQIDASLPLKKQLWQQTVKAKIINQAILLQKITGKKVLNMIRLAENVRSGDADNMEARAAVYYWKHVFPDIEDFYRDRNGVPPNNMLNYGYAILRAVVARALVSSGLLPTLGIHHHNRYNAYCLADDIMEPYRPYVDELVINIMNEFDDIGELTKNIKAKLLGVPVLDVKINNRRSPLMVAVQQTAVSLVRCFAGELKRIVYPEM